MYLPRCLRFLLLFFHPWHPMFSWGIICLVFEEQLLAFLLEQICWQWIFLVFLHLRVSLFHVLRNIFTGYKILVWRFFSFSSLNVFHLLLAAMVSPSNSVVIQCVLHLGNMLFFSAFKVVSLFLVFSSLVILCHIAHDLFYFIDLFSSSLTPFFCFSFLLWFLSSEF